MENIHAYTGAGSYPKYISINKTPNNEYFVTVRSDNEKLSPIDIALTKEQLLDMANDIIKELNT